MKNKTSLIAFALLLMFVLGCGMMKNVAKRSSTNFDPYSGGLSELLQPEISGGLVKFKLDGTRDTRDNYKSAKEAKGFTYIQEGAGVGVQVDGALVNFASSATATDELGKIAAQLKTTLAKKDKGSRFTANNGAIVGWTNGSLMCVVKSGFAKPAGNFEEAAPF